MSDMALPSAPEEREQGAVKEQEQLEATAPPSLEPTPAQADEATLEGVMETAAAAAEPVVQPEQQGQAGQQPYQPVLRQPNMWRIPHRYDGVLGTQPKSPRQATEDIGMFWDILASSPNVDPGVRAIANAIRGER